nr:glycogenin glucosyltransferase [Tanacetum cinerariifolium]
MVNMDEAGLSEWSSYGETIPILFDKVCKYRHGRSEGAMQPFCRRVAERRFSVAITPCSVKYGGEKREEGGQEEGQWWYYEPDLKRLEHIVSLHPGTCQLVLPQKGVMVIGPSNCTFMHFTQRMNAIISYIGGDQGFLNEIFVYWHILPKSVNSFTFFSPNITTEALNIRNRLFPADPPQLYVIHYFGIKPWLCYRDYDCNWYWAKTQS